MARPLERDDLKFIWAAYAKTGFPSMGEQFAGTEMGPDEFEAAFGKEVLANYTGVWSLHAETVKGFIPVGVVLAFWSHPDPRLAPFMIIGDMLWFPWSSPRNRIEAAVRFAVTVRDEFPMVEFARDEHVPFFEVLMKHGVVRRIGKSWNIYPGEQTTVFETVPR